MEIFRENPNFVNFGQKYMALCATT